MTLWVDADACPRLVKDMLFRAANRRQIELVLVANQPIDFPRSKFVRRMVVPQGFDVADRAIADQVAAGDLVVTADIPLAAAAVEKGATALNPRGELYTQENVRQHLSVRNFMDAVRSAGVPTGGPPPLHARDLHAFASQLDRWLARLPAAKSAATSAGTASEAPSATPAAASLPGEAP